MDEASLCKPWQTPNTPLLVLSSYPTKHSTVHPRYSTNHDISNPCVGLLLAKLSFHSAGPGPKPVCLIDVFPRRLSRKDFSQEQLGSEKLFQMLPPRLVQYWDTIAMDMVDRSSAKVVVVMGASARASYERHRRRRDNCQFEALEIPLGTGYLRQTW
jgi:hypothetical protein